MHLKSASDTKTGSSDSVLSPLLPASGPECLQFWYQLAGGFSNSNLTVSLLPGNTGNSSLAGEPVLWYTSTWTGVTWTAARVNIKSDSDYKVNTSHRLDTYNNNCEYKLRMDVFCYLDTILFMKLL